MDLQENQRESPDVWNAYLVGPLVIGIGVGVIFGSLFAMAKPVYVALLIAGAGLSTTIAGLLILRGLDKTDSDSERA